MMLLVIHVVLGVVHTLNRGSQGGSLVSGKVQQLGRCDKVITSQAEEECSQLTPCILAELGRVPACHYQHIPPDYPPLHS
jgi:hypothetical protein